MNHLRKSAIGRMKMLDIANENIRQLDKKMKDFNYGIIPDVMDTRTQYEKLQDRTYINQDIREKVFSLFNNDADMSEEFIELMTDDDIHFLEFKAVYPELVKRFKGDIQVPQIVFNVMTKLIENLNNSGNTIYSDKSTLEGIEQLKQFLQEQYDMGYVNKNDGDDMMDKLEAIEHILYKDNIQDFTDIKKSKSEAWKTGKQEMHGTINSLLELLTTESEYDKLEQLKNILIQLKQKSFLILQENEKSQSI